MAAAIVGALLLGGCSKNASPAADDAARDDLAQRSPSLLPLPGKEPAPARPAARASALIWDVPQGWVEEPPASGMRRAQYRVPDPAGDGECVVYFFGPGQGGDAQANAVRWAGQFRQPDGRPSTDVMKTWKLDGTRVPVQLVEVTGIYDGGMTMTDAPAESLEDYMLLGAIAGEAGAHWFFKFTGPEATVRAERDAFVGMMESLRPGA